MRFDGWNDELCHHGIRGQKWGIRRYQNPDGTLTAEGKARYQNERALVSALKGRSTRMKLGMRTNHADDIIYNNPRAQQIGRKLGKISKEYYKLKSEVFDAENAYYSNKTLENKKKYQDLSKKIEPLQKAYNKALKDAVDDLIGDFKNERITVAVSGRSIVDKRMSEESTIGDFAERILNEMAWWNRNA